MDQDSGNKAANRLGTPSKANLRKFGSLLLPDLLHVAAQHDEIRTPLHHLISSFFTFLSTFDRWDHLERFWVHISVAELKDLAWVTRLADNAEAHNDCR